MKKLLDILKNTAISVAILFAVNVISYFFRSVLGIYGLVAMFVVLGIFFISILTDGYMYGMVSAVIGAVMVRYLYAVNDDTLRFPYDVITTVFIIFSVAFLTCTLTITLKKERRIKEASIAEHMRANLLRAVSHDLRTPLTSIYASSSAILENFDSLEQTQRIELVEKIRTESHGLIRMLENLLSVTRVNSKDVKITKTPTVLWELIDSVLVRYNRYFPEQPVDVEMPDEFITIPMDPMLIEQVIFNILENANIHAMGMTKLKLKVVIKEDEALFEISDDGCGIPREKMGKMFKGYLDNRDMSDSSGRRNLGIGLSVCAAIINVHGGWIYANVNDMGGTSIYFSLKMEGEDE